jgi:hypothetical protein
MLAMAKLLKDTCVDPLWREPPRPTVRCARASHTQEHPRRMITVKHPKITKQHLMLREYPMPNNNCKISQFFFRNGENHVIFGVGFQVATRCHEDFCRQMVMWKPEGNCQQHQRIQERNLTSISWDIMGGFHPLESCGTYLSFDYKLSPDKF